MDLSGQFDDKIFKNEDFLKLTPLEVLEKLFCEQFISSLRGNLNMKWFFVTIFISLIFINQSIAAPQIRLCYEDVSVFPWITGDDKGLVITELHLVERLMNIKFTLVRLPWKRCQLEAQAGNMEGIIAASFNQDRTLWGMYPSEKENKTEADYRLHTDSFFVYIRKDSPIKWVNGKFENLGKNSVGVQLGYSVGSDVTKLGYPIHSSFTDAKDVLKELDLGIISVAVLQNHETLKILNENPELGKNIKRLEPPFKIADQYLLFTRTFFSKNQELSKEIWKAIKTARLSSEYKKEEEALLGKGH